MENLTGIGPWVFVSICLLVFLAGYITGAVIWIRRAQKIMGAAAVYIHTGDPQRAEDMLAETSCCPPSKWPKQTKEPIE